MRWEDISTDGVWTIATEEREKGNAGKLVLPRLAIEIIRARTPLASNPYVLAGRGASHIKGYSKAKRALDATAQIPHWQLHDLRRTARSLMSRAGVSRDHAERVLGHAIGGVEETYDRHLYREEQAVALNALAALVESIIRPPVERAVTPKNASA
jgi:integrase